MTWATLKSWVLRKVHPLQRLAFLEQRAIGQERAIKQLRAKLDLVATTAESTVRERDRLRMAVEEIHHITETQRATYTVKPRSASGSYEHPDRNRRQN